MSRATGIIELRERLLKLIDMVELRLDAEYILEELDVIRYLMKAYLGPNHQVTKEVEEWYNTLMQKYRNNMGERISDDERKILSLKASSWYNIVKSILF
ncbi:MAG: hypothetical protein ACTSXJ_05725 [Candidatus Baldrarchaeia archaeon]